MTGQPSRASARGARRFRTVLTASLATLAVLVAGLAVLNASMGPRVQEVQANPALLVTRAEQAVRIRVDQRLAERSIEGVTVDPPIPFQVAIDSTVIELRFGSMLRYGTEYTVRIPEAVSVDTGTTSSLEATVATPDPAVYTLLRETRTGDDGTKLDDTVRRQPLSAPAESEAVFSAPFIQEYAATSTLVAAVVLEAESARVQVTDAAGGEVYTVPMPDGAVRQLRGSGPSDLLGFAFSGSDGDAEYENVLFVYDSRDGSGLANPVVGIDGEPLSVADWTFVPGTTSVVAQTYDRTLYLIDVVSASDPLPLGQHGELRGFLPGGSTLVVNDPDGEVGIDLATGETSPLTLPAATGEPGLYPGERVVIGASREYVQLFTTPLDQPGLFASALALVTEEETRIIYSPPLEGSRVRDFCVSPNGQYLAVETAPAEAVLDEYPIVGGYTQMTTFFVDIATGEAARGAYGFLPNWCR